MTQDTVVVAPKRDEPTETEAPTRQIRRIAFGHRLSKWDVKLSPYLYISPFFIAFAITGLFPLLYTAYVSMHDWHLIGGEGDFVGFDNFAFELTNEKFWVAVRNTLSIFVISAVPQIILAITIAAVLDANIRAKTFWRMGVLLPFIVTPVAVAIIFSLLFANDTGAINGFLTSIGLDKVPWHSDVLASHFAIATMVNFRWTGYNALVLLAAMQAVPRDYHEAAMIDGANAVRRFFSITIPSLRPTLIFVVITSTIGGLQIFDEPRMYDQYGTGGNDYQWLTITMLIRNTGWDELNFGRAAAVAWLLFILIVLIAVINLLITRRISQSSVKVEEEAMTTQTTLPPKTRTFQQRRAAARLNGRPNAGGYAYLALVLLIAIFPIWYAFSIASGDAKTITQRSLFIWPGENFFYNISRVLENSAVDFWSALLNSIVVSTTVSIAVVLFSTLSGYAFAKLNFPGRRGLLVFVIATMAVPTQLAVVPLFIAMAQLDLVGTLWAVILPALTSAFGVFWMTQYLEQALPYELIEAARVDGANQIRTFWSVGWPAARPAAAMLALFTFIMTWTNFFWPFIVLDKDSRTLPVALSALSNNYFDDYSLIMAGVLISIVPLLLLFIVAGRQLVAGIMSGAVKG